MIFRPLPVSLAVCTYGLRRKHKLSLSLSLSPPPPAVVFLSIDDFALLSQHERTTITTRHNAISLLTTIVKLNEVDHIYNEATSENPDIAFLELAHGLELYINKFALQTVFKHVFRLSIELRYKTYEEYFKDNNRALTTRC